MRSNTYGVAPARARARGVLTLGAERVRIFAPARLAGPIAGMGEDEVRMRLYPPSRYATRVDGPLPVHHDETFGVSRQAVDVKNEEARQ
jgi:hypothetical protein